MQTGEAHFIRDKKSLRKLYYEHGPIALFAIGLTVLVCLSYYLSRFIPEDVFAHIISPVMHGGIIAVAVGGAVIMHWHIDGIRARRTWQMALITWASIEVGMWAADTFFGVSTIVRGVQTIDSLDFLMRDVLAIVLLAYPMEVLCPKWLNWWRGALFVVPPVLITMLDMTLHEDLRALQIIYPLLIAWWLWGHIRVYRAKVEDNFSSLENSAMPWLRIYLCILTVIGLSYFYLCFTYHPTRLFTQQWLVLLLLVYNTAQIVHRRQPWQETVPDNADEEDETENDEQRRLRELLEQWMEREKPYLRKDFQLTDLTAVLPMNRTYLSQFINMEYKCSFYQYATHYRIEEAKRLLRAHPDMKLLDVADQCGFSSSATFSRSFSNEEGCSPTDWIKTLA